jgi:plastocyanin
MPRIRRFPLRSVAAAALVGALAASVPALAAHKKPHRRTIPVGDYYFVKNSSRTPTVHVAPGTVMKWHFVGATAHNVTVESGPAKFHSRNLDHGFYIHRVSKQGTYLIECTLHLFKMRLVVGKASSNTTPAPAPAPSPSPYPY